MLTDFQWIRHTLLREKLIVHKKKEKLLFTKWELVNVLRTLWCKDDLIYVSERARMQYQVIFLVYNWTGARIGAFFNSSLLH